MYPKDTEKWKQFTTLDNQKTMTLSCFVSQRYWKMKAIHNAQVSPVIGYKVVLYPKDTEKWKQFTTRGIYAKTSQKLFCIPKILKNESNSQQPMTLPFPMRCCFVSQRYWKMKAIHNLPG